MDGVRSAGRKRGRCGKRTVPQMDGVRGANVDGGRWRKRGQWALAQTWTVGAGANVDGRQTDGAANGRSAGRKRGRWALAQTWTVGAGANVDGRQTDGVPWSLAQT
jgi:hypothetical protein